MKKVLVTAFDPFGGETTNPALEAVMRLPDQLNGAIIAKQELPTVFNKSVHVLFQALEAERPDIIISVGQAGGSACISLERVAININDANIVDNDGFQPVDTPVVEDAPTAYFTTLPIKAIQRQLRQAEIPSAISNSAGTYVCNHVMYAALHYAATRQPTLKAGFIHIPYLPTQTLFKPSSPSISLENAIASLKIIIQTACDDENYTLTS